MYGQHINSQQPVGPPIIVLKDGVKLYSADDNFNKQILGNKVILRDSDVFYQQNGDKDHFIKLVARKSPKEEKKDLE